MRIVRINVYDERTDIVRKKRNEKNILVVNYVFTKQKIERRKTNVDISHDSWGVQLANRKSSEGELVRVVRSPN